MKKIYLLFGTLIMNTLCFSGYSQNDVVMLNTGRMKVLSGGENAKVRLCKLMLNEINLLVLDEPTNHLDVDAKAELKKAISEFKGTVLLVSHEPDFYHDIVTDVWDLEQWTTKIV